MFVTIIVLLVVLLIDFIGTKKGDLVYFCGTNKLGVNKFLFDPRINVGSIIEINLIKENNKAHFEIRTTIAVVRTMKINCDNMRYTKALKALINLSQLKHIPFHIITQ